MRQYIVFIISLVLLFGSITTVIATKNIQDYDLRGYVDATQNSNLPYRIPRLGVNADLFQYDVDELSYHLDLMQTANINWIRQFIYWDEFEPTQGQYEWSQLDVVMATLSEYPQLQVIPVFMNSPDWSRQSDIVTAPPDSPSDIVPFLQNFVARYGDGIDYYQIWDEPNLDDAWGLNNPRPAEYTALLAESYRAIHGADSYATIILASLAPTSERAGQNIADNLYLQMLYNLDADAYFDAVSAKPYGFDTSPDNRTTNIDTLNFSRIILLREVMVANDDGHKALWASNWGWNSLPDDWAGTESIWGSVTETEQVDYTLDALNRAEREWAWLGGMIVHHWQPDVEDNDPQWGFAIIKQNDEPSALFDALADYSIPPSASNGLYHPRTEYADYSGLWTFSELGADIGWLETSDSQLDFEFYGTDIALLLREDDYFAFLYPTIDGEIANATPHDADGNSYILLRSGSHQPETNLIPVSRNLALDTHSLHIIADRGEDRWALAGYAVSSGDLAQPYQRQIQVAWFTTLIALVTTVASGWYLPWRKLYYQFHSMTSIVNKGIQFIITITTSIALMLGLLLSVGMPEPSLFRRDVIEQGLLIIITGGLLVIKVPLLVTLIAVLILFWFIYHHIEWGLLLTLFYAPFFLFPVELYTFFFPMSELLILITTTAWLLRLFVQWGLERQSANSDYQLTIKLKPHILDIAMLIWLGLAILAVTWSVDRASAITELRTLFIEPSLFYLIFRTSNLDRDKVKQITFGLICAGILVSIIGLYLYINGNVITAEGGVTRLVSVYGSPNNVGLLLGRLIPFVFAGVLLLDGKERVIAVSIFGLFLITVGLTQSVGALLFGVPIGIIVVCFCIYGRKAVPILIALSIIGLMVVLGLTQVSTRFASLLDLSDGTSFIRLRVWESSIEIIGKHPVTGLGLDQFISTFSGEYLRPDAIADPDLSHPHNIIFDFWIRLGVFSVVWLFAFIIMFWRSVYTTFRHSNHKYQKIMVIGIMGAMASLLAHGMIDNSIYVSDLSFIFVFLVASTVEISNMIETNEI